MLIRYSLAAVLAVAAAPSLAAQWLLLASGTLVQAPNPGSTIRLELPQLDGQPFGFGLVLSDAAPGTDVPPPFGIGQARSYFGALQGFGLSSGPFTFEFLEGGASQLLVLNDVRTGGNPNARQDQVSFNAGTVFTDGAAVRPIAVSPSLGDDIYVSSFALGTVAPGTIDAPATLISSVDFPDLEVVWAPFRPLFLSFQVRQGNPTTAAEQAALPVAFMNGAGLSWSVFRLPDSGVVPEPASWAMLIAGFGLVGGAVRRRRARPV